MITSEGIHRIGRMSLAAITVIVLGWVKIEIPDISEMALLTIASPALGYIGIKGKGNQTNQADNKPVV